MLTKSQELRHVVAWLPAIRVVDCLALWSVFGVASLLPSLQLPLRDIAVVGFAAAICRTLILLGDARWIPDWSLWRGAALGVDAVLLTGLLDITGGPLNPFLVIYVAYVWLAFVSLSSWWAIAVAASSSGGFGWLVIDHLQAGLGEHHRLTDFPTHLFTMWFTAVTVAELVAHYVVRARAELASRQREVEQARERAARSEHLASLMTLAAGAAHELSTPLATIAVAAGELSRNARAPHPKASALEDDARLIESAVIRCQAILDGMSGRATGTVLASAPLTPSVIVELASQDLSLDRQKRLRVEITAPAGLVAVSSADASRALSSLLKNAFDASDSNATVDLSVELSGPMLRFTVNDNGYGMSTEVLRRAGEPFFTTKAAGAGLGLGVFLARTIAEQAGGSLRFESSAGTTAILEIPQDQE